MRCMIQPKAGLLLGSSSWWRLPVSDFGSFASASPCFPKLRLLLLKELHESSLLPARKQLACSTLCDCENGYIIAHLVFGWMV